MGSQSTHMRPTAMFLLFFSFNKKWVASCHASMHFVKPGV